MQFVQPEDLVCRLGSARGLIKKKWQQWQIGWEAYWMAPRLLRKHASSNGKQCGCKTVRSKILWAYGLMSFLSLHDYEVILNILGEH